MGLFWSWARKIHKFVESDLSNSATWLASRGGVVAIVSFLSNIVLVRILAPADFGQYAVVRSNIGIITAVINFRQPDIILQASETEIKDGLLGRVGTSIFVEALLTVGVSIILLSVANVLVFGAFLLLWTTLSMTWLKTEMRLFERSFDYRRLTILEMISHVVAHTLAVVCAMLGVGAIVLYLRGVFRSCCILLGMWQIGTLGSFPIRLISMKEWKGFLRRVRGFWGDSLFEQSFRRLLFIVSGALASEKTTGYLFQARRLAVIPNQLIGPVTSRLGLNYLSNLDTEMKEKRLTQAVVLIGTLMIPVCGGAWLLADPLIPLVFGRDWQPVVPLLLLMTGVIAIHPMLETIKTYFMSKNNMTPFMILGRGGQYGGLVGGALVTLVTGLYPSEMLAIGLSIGYIMGGVGAFVYIRLSYQNQSVE
jgi:O-antigen/teichoic acid export membrane protein